MAKRVYLTAGCKDTNYPFLVMSQVAFKDK